MENRRALITGIAGQDGSYLAELLYSKGYEVYGVVREGKDPLCYKWLQDAIPNVKIYDLNIFKNNNLYFLINSIHPHEIYNLASSSNVFDAWRDLDYVMELDAKLPQRILECIVKIDKSIKFFQASSCLVFGRDKMGMQGEYTNYQPLHPYGVSKAYADGILKEFRNTYNLFACSGILYNHESIRRGKDFFTQKITGAVAKIKMGLESTVKVGNLNAYRDMGYATDFVEAFYLMMQNKAPVDYVIGTGELIQMINFSKKCFEYVGLDCVNHLDVDSSIYRNIDTTILKADITKIKSELNWKPKHSIDDIIKIMIDHHLSSIKNK